jgi:hypothetical protein
MRCRVLIAIVFITVCTLGNTADQYLDLVTLRDGTQLSGVIIDQNTGESLKLETFYREVLTVNEREITRIEKVENSEYLFDISFIDVVCLSDGVIFKGLITEQVPGSSLTLLVEENIELTFPMKEVFRVLKQKQVEATRLSVTEAQDKVLKTALQIEINLGTLRSKNLRGPETNDSGKSHLEEELSELKEEIQELEHALEEAELERTIETLATQEQQIETIREELGSLIDELIETLERCNTVPADSVALWRLPEMHKLQPITHHLAAFSFFNENCDERAQVRPVDGQDMYSKDLGELRGTFAGLLEELSGLAVVNLVDGEELDRQAAIIEAQNELAFMLQTQHWKRIWNMPRTMELIDQIPQDDRELVYATHKNQNLWLGVGLNAIPMLHIGSWVQGNVLGALIGYAHTIAAIGVTVLLMDAYWVDQPYQDAQGYYHKFTRPAGLGWLAIGAIGASYAVGLLQPVLYIRKWNRRLARQLDVDPDKIKREHLKISLAAPGVEPIESGDIGITVKLVSLSY